MKWILDRLILMVIIGALLYGSLWALKMHYATKKEIAIKQLEHNDSRYLGQLVELKNEILKLKSESISERKIKKIVKTELDEAVNNIIKKHHETISGISVTSVNTHKEVNLDPKIWKHYANPNNPQSEYYFMKLYKSDLHGTKIPWAWVMYFPNKDKKWKYGFYDLKLKSKTVITKQKTGGMNSYTQLTIENTNDKESKGKIQKLKISKNDSYFKFVYPPKRNQFYWWNPNLSLGYGAYYNINDNNIINGMEFGFNFLNYGIKERVSYKFITFGIGSNFGEDNWIFMTPFELNMMRLHIPLIKHLHLTPLKIGYTDHNDWLIGTGLNIEF